MSLAYERRLDTDFDWAIREGSMHFEGKSGVHATLEKITRRLNELHIPYAVAGGMALFFHGLRRFTKDVRGINPYFTIAGEFWGRNRPLCAE
jgi:hypothetical protein